jgi:peptidyl-prolyl cis-trans isomerase SurA
MYLYRKNHQHKPDEFTKEKIEEYLDLFINYKLKVAEAQSRGMDTTAAFRKEYQTYREELLKPYMPDSKVIDSLVALTYERLKEEVNASHILISLNPDVTPADTLEAFKKITELRERAMAGEDFGALAANHSEEPGAETSKGNLGFFTAMQMVFPFEQAAYLTPVGQISAPVRTQFGYHIVKVMGRQPSRGEVEVSHIMLRTADKDDIQVKNTIFELYDRLRKGMSWDELCQQYSEDPGSKDKGGRLRPFGVGAMASVPQFQEAAFSLDEPGEISDPVQTQFGWHILRLESKIPLPSFEELKPSLTQRVSRDERVRISREALRERMRREFGYAEEPGVKEALLTQAENILEGGTAGLQAVEDKVLFTMGNKAYPVKDFLSFVAEQPARQPSISARQHLNELLTRFADNAQSLLLEEKVTRESPDYKWLLKEYYEGILLFEIMEKEVWNKAMEDSVGQRNYFLQNASKYKAGERMAGKIYNTGGKNNLEILKDMLTSGDEGVAEFIAVNKIRVDSGAFEQKDRMILGKITWAPGTYTAEHNGVQYLIVIDKILPPGDQTFEEARASVISDYQTFLEDSWIRELKRKFEVKVEKKAKKRAFSQLMDQTGKV